MGRTSMNRDQQLLKILTLLAERAWYVRPNLSEGAPEQHARLVDQAQQEILTLFDENLTTVSESPYPDRCPDCGGGFGEHYTHCIHHHG